jgi:hypothetical protein
MQKAFFGALSLLFSSLLFASNEELQSRFTRLGLELRSHRAEMLKKFHEEWQENRRTPIVGKVGRKIYLRWISASHESPRRIYIEVLDNQGSKLGESVSIREDPSWGLFWYSAFIPEPEGRNIHLKIRAEYEQKFYQTPFRQSKTLKEAYGSLALVLEEQKSLFLKIELDQNTPFVRGGYKERGLKISSIQGGAQL